MRARVLSASRLEGEADGAAAGVRTDDRTDLTDEDLARVVRRAPCRRTARCRRSRPASRPGSRRRRSSAACRPGSASAFVARALRAALLRPCRCAPRRCGLIDSTDASIALAPPMRPPFFRLSSVSSAPHTFVRSARSAGHRGDVVERRASLRSRAHAVTMTPCPIVTDWLSITVIGTSSATARDASSALCIVAESPPLSEITTMPVAPSAISDR